MAVHVGIGAELFYKVHLDWDSVRVLRIDEFERLRAETQNYLVVVFWGDASEYLIWQRDRCLPEAGCARGRVNVEGGQVHGG
ncbi:Uncharacterised protein [Chlamydia trachomatis]|nr:Uncharacterised protein [Chlamydia trachomatis]